ncbi:MAG: hypothetical protein NTX53_09295 [candidate division WOR-3 bacterium]|nr:hypothetical protein [candidate division WOR-3 bacterium]
MPENVPAAESREPIATLDVLLRELYGVMEEEIMIIEGEQR